MKNSLGRRLLGWMLCAGLALAMMIVLLPAQEAKAGYNYGDKCPECGQYLDIGFVFNDSIGGFIHGVICPNGDFTTVEYCFGGTATCTEKAKCVVCGAEYGEKNPDNHDWSEWEDCVIHAKHERECKRTGCGAEEEVDCVFETWFYVDAQQHGSECEVCHHPERRDHSGGTAYCNQKATCDICGEKYGEVDLDNHPAGFFHPATCVQGAYCEVEDRVFDEGRKNPDNHPADKVTAATCTLQAYCSACQNYFGDPLGHDLIHHDAKAATCTAIGWKAYDTCSRCTYSTYEEIPALGHDLVHHDAKAPTCTEIGWKTYDTCSRCDYSTYEEIPALGHDLIHHDAKAATCTAIGWKAYDTCSRCDYSTYEEKAALGHDLIHHDAKASTCTEIGWDAYDTCTRCDYSTYEEIPALGHDEVIDKAVEATCTKTGLTEGKHCSRCEWKVGQKEVPAKGHTPAAAVKENEKTPEIGVEGSYDEVVYCSVCKAELSRKTIPIDPLPEPARVVVDQPLVKLLDESKTVELRFFKNGTFTLHAKVGRITAGKFFLENDVLSLEVGNVIIPVTEDGSLSFTFGDETWSFLFPEVMLATLRSTVKK